MCNEPIYRPPFVTPSPSAFPLPITMQFPLSNPICSARKIVTLAFAILISLLPATNARASTSIAAAAMLHRSSGSATSSDVTLSENGYVGTYVVVPLTGPVSLSVDAYGTIAGGELPRMNVVVADMHSGWDVATLVATHTFDTTLPAGTYFVRVELVNATPDQSRHLTIRNLSVTGANIHNPNDSASRNAAALAASDTYIQHFRTGHARVALPGVAPGTTVDIVQIKHAFRFGTEVPGFSNAASVDTVLADNPAPGSDAERYQARLLRHFNSLTPGNAGKWDSNEAQQDIVTMEGIDRMLEYAATHDLRFRQHAMIWGTQQPAYIVALTAQAALPGPTGETAKAELMLEIQERIDYYVWDRAEQYDQIDIYNESYHTGEFIPAATYWQIYGPDGIAQIYNDSAAAAAAGGNENLLLFTNEYNVLNDNGDGYCGWYRQHVEQLINAGGNIGGIGIQYYSYEQIGDGAGQHNPHRILGTLQHLSVLHRPLELTEFGIKDNGTGTDEEKRQLRARILDESMRLVFGQPQSTGFTIWGFWAGDVWDQAPNAYLYDQTWNLSPTGQAYIDLVEGQWTTVTTATVQADGTVSFDGFYGDYVISTGNTLVNLTLTKSPHGDGSSSLLPDLTLSDSDIQVTSEQAGKTAWISATIHNQGNTAALDIPVRFSDNQQPVGSIQTIAQLSPGESAQVAVLWSVKHQDGARTIEVKIDPDTTIGESDENNNSASIVVLLSGNNGGGNGTF